MSSQAAFSNLFSPPGRRGGFPGGGRGTKRAENWSGASVGLMGRGILLLLDSGLEAEESVSRSSRSEGMENLSRSRADGKCSQDKDRDGDSGAKLFLVGESGSRTGMRLVRGDNSRGDAGTGEAGTASTMSPVVSPWFGVVEGPTSGQPESLSTSFSVGLTKLSWSFTGAGGWEEVLGGRLGSSSAASVGES